MSEAKITLTAKDDTAAAFAAVEQRLDKLHLSGETVKATFDAIGVTVSAGYFADLIKETIEAGEHLGNLNKTTDISVEELSGLQLLAKQSGTDIDGLAKAVSRMQVEIGKAPDKFRELGITATTGTGALKQFSDIFALLPNINQRNALAQAVFQRSWQEMAPILTLGSEKIQEAVDKGTELSSMTTAQARASEELNGKLAELTSTHGFLNQQVQTLLPLLIATAESLTDLQGKGTALDQEAFHPLAETFRAVVVLGGNVAYVIKSIANEAVTLATQLVALGHADFTTFNFIHDDAVKTAEAARAAFDAWEKKIMSTGTALETLGNTSAAADRKAQDAASAAAAKFLQDKKAADAAYDSLMKRIAERIAEQQQEIDKGRALSDQEKFETKIKADLEVAHKKLTAAQIASVNAKLADEQATALVNEQLKQQLDFAKQVAQETIKDNEDYEAYTRAQQKLRDQVNASLADQKIALMATNEQLQLEASLTGASDSAKSVQIELLQIEQQRKEAIRKLNDSLIQQGVQMTQQDRDAAIAQINANAALASQNVMVKAGLEDQKQLLGDVRGVSRQLWDDLTSDSHDKLKSVGADIKKFIYDELYQIVERQWIIPIAAQLTGSPTAAAMSALGSGSGALPSVLGGGFSLASLGSLQSGGAGLFGSIGSALGIGSSGAAVGSAAPAVFNAAADSQAANVALGLSGEAGMLGAMGQVGWAGLAALAAYSLFGGQGGGPKTESGYGAGVPLRGDASGATTIAQSLQADYAARAAAIGVNPNLSNVGVFYAQDPQGTAKTQLELTAGSYDRAALTGSGPLGENVGRDPSDLTNAVALADAQAELKNFQEQATGEIGDFLKTVNITTASLADMQKALDIATDVGTLDHALANLGDRFSGLVSLSVQDKESLAQQFGGVQNLVAGMANFNDKFLSDAEKQQLMQQQLTHTFADAGVTLPASIDDYKQAVLDAEKAIGSDAGDKTFATLINNAQAFYDVAQTTASGLTGISDTLKGLQSDSASLQVQLLRAQGNTGAADAAQFTIDTAGMAPDEVAQYKANQDLQAQIDALTAASQKAASVDQQRAQLQDELNHLTLTNQQLLQLQRDSLDASNQGLFDQIQAIQAQQAAQQLADQQAAQALADQQAAQQLADQKAAAVAQERATLQDQLNQLTLTNDQLLQMQRDSLDASNQALFDQVQAVKAEQAAAAAAAAHEQAIADEHARLETQLLQMTGDTAALRQQELDALQPENRALMEQIYALQDAKTAEDERTKAMQKAQQQLQQQKTLWSSLADGIQQQAARIMDLVTDSSPDGYNLLQSKFAIATAQARAHDQDAAKSLPGLAQQLVDAGQNQAVTLADLQFLRTQVAGSLNQTASMLDGSSADSQTAQQVKSLVAEIRRGRDEQTKRDKSILDALASISSAVNGNNSAPILVEIAT